MRIETLKTSKEERIMIYTVGIIGTYQNWEHRLDMVISLSELNEDSIPINAFILLKDIPLKNIPRILFFESVNFLQCKKKYFHM